MTKKSAKHSSVAVTSGKAARLNKANSEAGKGAAAPTSPRRAAYFSTPANASENILIDV